MKDYDAHEYRRPKSWGYQKWHFCRNCSKWPSGDFEMRRYKPAGYDLCGQCKRIARDGRASGPYGI